MTNDVFNNPSNDYVNPGLAPCVNIPDGNSGNFKFIDDGAGVVVGSEIASFMDLSAINVSITSWSQNKMTLQSGEVVYVPGDDKGLMNKTQVFDIPSEAYVDSTSKYFMEVDLSINYYNNFKYYNINIDASSDYSQNIAIDEAINTIFSNRGIKIEVTYDPSNFTFVGSQEGYDFEISNVILRIVDASMNSSSPFPPLYIDEEMVPQIYYLVEDISSAIPAMKYPNGAMLGYMIKTRYPSNECINDCWIYKNHVESPYTVFYPSDNKFINVDSLSLYESLDYNYDFPIFPEVDHTIDPSLLIDLSIVEIDSSAFDPSINSATITNDVISGTWIGYSSITDSSMYESVIVGSGLGSYDPDASNYLIGAPTALVGDISVGPYGGGNYLLEDSSVVNSGIYITQIINSAIQDSNVFNCDISTGILNRVDIAACEIRNSVLKGDNYYSTLTNSTDISNSIIQKYNSIETLFSNSVILDSILSEGIIKSSIVSNTILGEITTKIYVQDSSLVNCYVLDAEFDNVFVDSSNGTYITRTNIVNSRLKEVTLNNDTSISNSYIYNAHTNAYLEPSDVPVWFPDASTTIVFIRESNVMDSSINNTYIYDTSIWTSSIQDSSLIRCTIYNSDIDDSTTVTDCTIITIDASLNGDISYDYDTSTYYEKSSRKVDVGRSGAGDAGTITAGEYLDYINTYDLWDKIGPFASRISAPDAVGSSIQNLIGGFYLFNPQLFPVNVEYMIIN